MARNLTKADRQGLVIFAFIGALIVAAVTAKMMLQSGQVRTDPDTLCPTRSTYAHTVVLIDKTDPLSEGQRRAFRSLIKEIREILEIREKLSIFVLDDTNYSAPAAAFALCNPGTGADANELTQNPRKIHRNYLARFGAPLDRVIDDLSLGEEARTSPIMEMIQSVSFVSDFDATFAPRRLFIVSDMMQNTPEYSHYRSGGKRSKVLDFDRFRQSPRMAAVATNLDRVDVRIVYLIRPRTGALQTREHILFWEQFFAEAGARVTEVRPVR
jgi:hypothetical protein